MAIYSAAQAITWGPPASATPAADLMAPPLAEVALLEWGFIVTSNTNVSVGLGRAATPGVQIGAVNVQSEDIRRPPGLSTVAVAWSTPPTIPTRFHRRVVTGGSIGNGAIQTWPRGLICAAGSSFVQWCLLAAATGVVHWQVDE